MKTIVIAMLTCVLCARRTYRQIADSFAAELGTDNTLTRKYLDKIEALGR